MKTGIFNQARISFVIILLAFAFLGIIFFIIMPQLRKIEAMQKEIVINKQQFAILSEEVNSYELSVAGMEKILRNRDYAGEVFPTRETMVSLVEGLEDSADKTGVTHDLTITDLGEKPSPPVAGKEKNQPVVTGLAQVQEVPFTLVFSGSYRQILDFLSYLENLPYYTEMKSFSVTADQIAGSAQGSVINTGQGSAKLEGVFLIRTQ